MTFENDAQEMIYEATITKHIFNATSPYFERDAQGLLLCDNKELCNCDAPTHVNYNVAPTHANEDSYEACRLIGVSVDIGTLRLNIGKQKLSRLYRHLGR